MVPQPIVILGGFLISPEAYAPMAERLEQLAKVDPNLFGIAVVTADGKVLALRVRAVARLNLKGQAPCIR